MRRYLSADERGSIISVSDSSGDALAINAYDEYGVPAFGALPNQRFGYAGAMWLQRAGVYQMTYRAYAQRLGRFSQADPIGYAAGPNLYAYVGNDPVNFVDPLGLEVTEPPIRPDCIGNFCPPDVTVTGIPQPAPMILFWEGVRINQFDFGGGAGGGGGGGGGGGDADITQRPSYCANFDYKIARKADEIGKLATTAGTFGTLIPHPVTQGVSKVLSGGGAALSLLSNVYTSTYYPSIQGNTSAAVGITAGTVIDRSGLGAIPAWAVGQAADWTTEQAIGDPCR